MSSIIGDFTDVVFEQITSLGGAVFYAIVTLFTLFIGELWLFISLALTFVLIMAVSLTIKMFFFKERPDKKRYKNIIEKLDASSFPSIHSAKITALATILSYYVGGIWVTALLGVTALLVSYSRIYLNRHYFSDVIGGIVLGGIVAVAVIILV